MALEDKEEVSGTQQQQQQQDKQQDAVGAANTAAGADVGADDEEVAELTTFRADDAYVYAPLPPAPSYGHRAELWDVNKWLQVCDDWADAG